MINKLDKESTVNTFEELVKSDYCMMYFTRGCRNKRIGRGLCNKHYHMIRRCVKAGSLTWEKVVKQLKALPYSKESASSFIKELNE